MPRGVLEIFTTDRFNVTALTAAINDLEFVPGRIGELGLFGEEGVATTVIEIERQGDLLSLVSNAPRGGASQVVVANKRTIVPVMLTHLPQRSTINADEVQGVREFGSQDALQSIWSVVEARLKKMRRNLDATHEWQRIGAIRGKVLDADATTVLVDLYQLLGGTQTTVSFGLTSDTTEVRSKCLEALEAIEKALGAVGYTGIRAFCGSAFWASLISHKAVKETYLNSEQAAALRGDPRESFLFGGILWERYRGNVGTAAYVPTNEAYIFPEGVPDLFLTRFGPADYMETVNTIGLPYYAKQELTDFGKGVLLEAQSNPIHLCSRPKAVIKATR